MKVLPARSDQWIILFFILLYVIIHIGFYKTYFIYFPEFEKFDFLHHLHGGIMSGWVLLLIVQAFLISKGKHQLHRVFGKISYGFAPVVILFMFLILRMSFYKHINERPAELIMSFQIITWSELLAFTLFYILAIINKANRFKHTRYMIGTGIIMLIPGLGRVLGTYTNFPEAVDYLFPIALAILILIMDIRNRKSFIPGLVLSVVFVEMFINFYFLKLSSGWQVIGRFIINNLYQ